MMRSSAWEKSWIFSPVSLSYTMVPTGTLRTTLSPSRPVQFEPSPWRPRSAVYSGLKRKWTSVLWRSLESMMTSPPRPPSPPEGPPRGTNFSRRKAMQPLPPSPALTRILASSMNMIRRMILQWTRPSVANLARGEFVRNRFVARLLMAAFLLLPSMSAQQVSPAPKNSASAPAVPARPKLTAEQEHGLRLLKTAQAQSGGLQPDMRAFVLWQAGRAYTGLDAAKASALMRQAFQVTRSVENPPDDPNCDKENFCVKGW